MCIQVHVYAYKSVSTTMALREIPVGEEKRYVLLHLELGEPGRQLCGGPAVHVARPLQRLCIHHLVLHIYIHIHQHNQIESHVVKISPKPNILTSVSFIHSCKHTYIHTEKYLYSYTIHAYVCTSYIVCMYKHFLSDLYNLWFQFFETFLPDVFYFLFFLQELSLQLLNKH